MNDHRVATRSIRDIYIVGLAIRGLRLVGVDQAVLFTISSRFWQVFASPITMLMIVNYLTPDEQGFYYTFQSILGLQVFVELGLTGVLMQFVSHEWIGLAFSHHGGVIGDLVHRDRYASLVRLGARWFAIGAAVLIVFVIPVGSIFFGSQQHPGIEWFQPWLLLVLLAGLLIQTAPYFSILEGSHKVRDVAIVRTVASVLASIILWIALFFRLALFAPALMNLSIFAVYSVFLIRKYPLLFRIAWDKESQPQYTVKWKDDLWPMQWRTAVTWVASYFLWQLFTPVLFYYSGAKIAGQMGISLSVAMALQMTCLAWMTTKAPLFGTLVAESNFRELRRLSVSATKQSFVLLMILSITALGGLAALGHFIPHFAARFLPLPLFGLLLIAFWPAYLTSCAAIFLRSFKNEPLVWMVVVNSLSVGLCVWLLGQRFGVSAMLLSLFLINSLVGLPWTVVILRRKWMLAFQTLD